jgi:hypothetical protein
MGPGMFDGLDGVFKFAVVGIIASIIGIIAAFIGLIFGVIWLCHHMSFH